MQIFRESFCCKAFVQFQTFFQATGGRRHGLAILRRLQQQEGRRLGHILDRWRRASRENSQNEAILEGQSFPRNVLTCQEKPLSQKFNKDAKRIW